MSKIELVFIPYPGMGHLLSMVEFAKLIVQNNTNISITFLIYHMPNYEPTKINAYIKSQSSHVDPHQITFVTLPPLSNPPSPENLFRMAPELHNPLVKQAIEDRQAKPAAIVLDLMNASMIDVANELHVPSYIYFTAGANLLYTLFHFQAFAEEKGIDEVIGLMNDLDVELDLCGFRNPVPVTVLPWSIFSKGDGTLFVLDRTKKYREAKGILVNSFVELESTTFQVLQELNNVPTIYPVGPILSVENLGDCKTPNNNSSSSENDKNDIISWLDEQPKSSVVFLCFGSMGCFDTDQVKEIAEGLDRSGYRFLWSLRKMVQVGSVALPSEYEIFEEALPKGFINRTAHKGKIIAWAPQTVILGHPAIGGFVSHCGWNSIVESVWFGVPIATWPLYAEQQLNAFTIVKDLELSVEISLDYRWDFKKQKGSYLVMADEVEIGITKLMSNIIEKALLMSTDGKMRENVKQMSDKSKKAVEDGGSSYNSLGRFIENILSNVV